MPLDKIAFYGAGWQIHAENLAAYLAGRDGNTEARWDELVPPYQDLAPTLASTQSPALGFHSRTGACQLHVCVEAR
jgi:hypothetical protein